MQTDTNHPNRKQIGLDVFQEFVICLSSWEPRKLTDKERFQCFVTACAFAAFDRVTHRVRVKQKMRVPRHAFVYSAVFDGSRNGGKIWVEITGPEKFVLAINDAVNREATRLAQPGIAAFWLNGADPLKTDHTRRSAPVLVPVGPTH